MTTRNFKATTFAVVIKFDVKDPSEIAIKTFLESLEKRNAKIFIKTIFALEFTKDIDYSIDSSNVFKTKVISEKLEKVVSKYAKPLTQSGDDIFWLNFSRDEKDYGSIVPIAYLLGDGFSSYLFTLMEKYYNTFIDAFMTKAYPNDITISSPKEAMRKPTNSVVNTSATLQPTPKPNTTEELMAYMKSLLVQHSDNTK